jgi:hypothetical protein
MGFSSQDEHPFPYRMISWSYFTVQWKIPGSGMWYRFDLYADNVLD